MAIDSGAKTPPVEPSDYRDRNSQTADFIERVRVNQQKLTGELRPHYDFIVCGSGSSGSVVARRLAENSDVSVLLLEAGGGDDVPSVTESHRWIENFGTERDWSLVSQPNPNLKGRSFGTRRTGITSHPSRAIRHGTMSRCWRSTAELKTGRAHRTRDTVEQEGWFLCSPRLTRIQSLRPWWRARVRLEYRPSKVTMAR